MSMKPERSSVELPFEEEPDENTEKDRDDEAYEARIATEMITADVANGKHRPDDDGAEERRA